MNHPLNILSLTFDQLVREMQTRYGSGKFHATGLYRDFYKASTTDISHIREFSKSPRLIGKLERDLLIPFSPVVQQQREGDLVKLVIRLADGFEIESVIIPMEGRITLCVSSQVGCKMGCVFCETGKMGLIRNLTVDEIVGQVYQVKSVWGIDVKNIVFMGMGEPFDNLKNVRHAIGIICDQRGLNIAKRHITLSTAGLKNIKAITGSTWSTLKLAISLNAPNDSIRSRIMPVNRVFSMKHIQEALTAFPRRKKTAFLIEYVLIKGINNERSHARELADFVRPFPAKLNVIPLNPGSDTPFISPTDSEVQQFCDWLIDENVFVRKRSKKGSQVMAACGQLGNRKNSRYGFS